MIKMIRSALLIIPALVPVGAIAEDWNGFYLGGQVGSIETEMSYMGRTASEDSGTYGLLAGYNYTLGSNVMIGAELNLDKLNYSKMPFAHDLAVRRVKARLGYDLGRVMLYGSLGYSEIGDGTGNTEDGTSYGFGVDYEAKEKFVLGAEVQRDSYDFEGISMDITALRVRMSFKF